MPAVREAQLEVNGRIYTVRVRQVTEVTPNPENTNRGKPRGVSALDESMQKTGAHRGIFTAASGEIVGGNHAYQSAVSTGAVDAIVEVESDGKILVSTRRKDWKNARDPTAVLAAIADNRTQELNFDLDPEMFASAIVKLEQLDIELPAVLYTEDELDKLFHQKSGSLLSLDDEEEEDEPTGGGIDGDKFPLAIVLDSKENKRWKAYKDKIGLKTDKTAFLKLLEGANV